MGLLVLLHLGCMGLPIALALWTFVGPLTPSTAVAALVTCNVPIAAACTAVGLRLAGAAVASPPPASSTGFVTAAAAPALLAFP